jgi:hypothetical protein
MVSLMLPPAKLDQPSPLLQVQLPPLPVQVLPLPIQVLPPQYETASAVKDGSVRTLFWDAVARVQEGDFGAEFEQFNSSDFHIFSFDFLFSDIYEHYLMQPMRAWMSTFRTGLA